MMDFGLWVVLIASLLASFVLGLGAGGLSIPPLTTQRLRKRLIQNREELHSILDVMRVKWIFLLSKYKSITLNQLDSIKHGTNS
jgi:hypothetical protein